MYKKIIFSVPNLQRGGAERFLSLLYNEFNLQGWHKILLLGKKEGDFLKDIKNNSNIHEIGSLKTKNAFWKTIKLLRKEKPDVVICSLGFVVLYSLVKLMPFTPKFMLICRIGNSLSIDQLNVSNKCKKILRYYINLLPFWVSDVVIAQSQSMKNDFISVYGNKIKSSIVVIYNGVNQELIYSNTLEKSNFEINFNKINFVLVGRLFEQKGYDILIKAISNLDDETNSKIVFNICGKGPLEKKLKQLCVDLNVNNVRFLGELSNPYSFMALNDCLILPSRYEGFSNTLIESQYLGLPAIVSDSPGGNVEVINDHKLGLVFDNLNTFALSDAIVQYIENIDQFDSEFITKTTIKRYSIENISNQYANLLLRV